MVGALQVFAQKQPNVLFIAIDDINDWVEPLEGNKQALTPNMNKFTESEVMAKGFTTGYEYVTGADAIEDVDCN